MTRPRPRPCCHSSSRRRTTPRSNDLPERNTAGQVASAVRRSHPWSGRRLLQRRIADLLGETSGVLDDLERPPVHVQDRASWPDPDFPAALPIRLYCPAPYSPRPSFPEVAVRSGLAADTGRRTCDACRESLRSGTSVRQKLSLAVMTVPSSLNSITAWALLMAASHPRNRRYAASVVMSVAYFTILNGRPISSMIGL